MPTTTEFIKQLHDKRLRAVGQMRGIADTVEQYSGGKFSGEDERQFQELDAEQDALGKRLDELIAGEKASRAADEQRARFEKIVRPDGRENGQPKRSIVRDAMRGEGPRVFEADFRNFSHKFEPDGRLTIESWDLSKLTNAAGLYTVPQDFLEELFRHLVENTGVRAAGARQITTTDGRSMPVPKTLTHGGAAAVAENATIPESDPTFGQAVLGAYKYGQLIQVSNELATDTGIDLDGYLADAAGSNLGLASGADYVGGSARPHPTAWPSRQLPA